MWSWMCKLLLEISSQRLSTYREVESTDLWVFSVDQQAANHIRSHQVERGYLHVRVQFGDSSLCDVSLVSNINLSYTESGGSGTKSSVGICRCNQSPQTIRHAYSVLTVFGNYHVSFVELNHTVLQTQIFRDLQEQESH